MKKTKKLVSYASAIALTLALSGGMLTLTNNIAYADDSASIETSSSIEGADLSSLSESADRAVGYGENATYADEENTIHVSNKSELVKALKEKTSKIIILNNDINLCIDSKGNEFTPGESDPSEMIWKSGKDMAKDVMLNVNSNTTILGQGHSIYGGGLKVKDADNVIIRYVSFEDAYDFFPEWDTDEWNTELDNAVITNSTNVWFDHCSFSDGANKEIAKSCKDKNVPIHHDGLLDIKDGSDYVTISHSVFKDHNKAILMGSSDSRGAIDGGKLHVTFCYNYFENIKERSPRLRFGQVHSFNNYYRGDSAEDTHYVFGLGKNSTIYADNDIFDLNGGLEYRIMNGSGSGYYYEGVNNIVNGEVKDETAIDKSGKPAYAENAEPDYDYSSIKLTTSNYEEVKEAIVENAGPSAN